MNQRFHGFGFALAVAVGTACAVAPAAAQGRGTVQGTITLKGEPARRVASRYAGAATPSTEQSIPAVVYLRGGGLPHPHPLANAPAMAQRDTAFDPALIVVPAGTRVDFPNRDPFYHNVFSYSKTKRFDLGRFPRPESKSVLFDKAGVVNVFCEIHRSMRGVVLVTESDYYAVVQPDGGYRITGVPPGRYELVVWHVDRGRKTLPVTITSDGVATVNATL